jgi:hypothetical protein
MCVADEPCSLCNSCAFCKWLSDYSKRNVDERNLKEYEKRF